MASYGWLTMMLKAEGMNKNKSDDLCRVAGELAELAVLLRTYRLNFLAKKLDWVRQFLELMDQANSPTQKNSEAIPAPGPLLLCFKNSAKNNRGKNPFAKPGTLSRGRHSSKSPTASRIAKPFFPS